MELLWFIVGTALSLLVVARVVTTRRPRRRKLRELAARHRLSFAAHDHINLHQRYHNLELIRRGHSRHAQDVLYGATDTGPLSLFSYAYDEGFGVRRRAGRWWLAVIETESPHDTWWAEADATSRTSAEARERIGSFRLTARHGRTLGDLRACGIERLLKHAPPAARFEVRGRLAAVAVPEDGSDAGAERALDLARALGKTLSSQETGVLPE